jgi:hypothetical protein
VGYQASFTVLAVLTSVILMVAFWLNSRAQERKQAELAAQAPAE